MACNLDLDDAQQYTVMQALTCYQAILALTLGVHGLRGLDAVTVENERAGELLDYLVRRS